MASKILLPTASDDELKALPRSWSGLTFFVIAQLSLSICLTSMSMIAFGPDASDV